MIFGGQYNHNSDHGCCEMNIINNPGCDPVVGVENKRSVATKNGWLWGGDDHYNKFKP